MSMCELMSNLMYTAHHLTLKSNLCIHEFYPITSAISGIFRINELPSHPDINFGPFYLNIRIHA